MDEKKHLLDKGQVIMLVVQVILAGLILWSVSAYNQGSKASASTSSSTKTSASTSSSGSTDAMLNSIQSRLSAVQADLAQIKSMILSQTK